MQVAFIFVVLSSLIRNCVGFVGRYKLLVAMHVCIGVCGGERVLAGSYFNLAAAVLMLQH
jgi:hypothetical protein